MYRKLISHIIFHTRAVELWRLKNRHSITIITLHSVLDTEDDLRWTPLRSYISTAELDNNLQFLKKHFTFISLEDAISILHGQSTTPPHPMVVTFDDGYLNNLKYAQPILERYSVPFTIFLCVEPLKQKMPFWFDRLDYAIQHNINKDTIISVENSKVIIDTRNRKTLKASLINLINKVLDTYKNDLTLLAHVTPIIEQIESRKGCTLLDIYHADKCSLVMSEEDLMTAAQSPLATFGSHTLNHARLPCLNLESAKKQLSESRSKISKLVEEPCNFFCYPNGSYSELSAQLVKESGYHAGLSCKEGLNKPGDDIFNLKRFNLQKNCSPAEMLCEFSGVFNAVNACKRFIATVKTHCTRKQRA